MYKKQITLCSGILGLAVLLFFLLAGCAPLQTLFQNPHYIYENGAVLVGGDEEPLMLNNNPEVVDVNY